MKNLILSCGFMLLTLICFLIMFNDCDYHMTKNLMYTQVLVKDLTAYLKYFSMSF